jgi:predicted dehydrogenase
MRVAIIGAGLQCRRRAPVIAGSKTDQLVVICGSAEEPTRQMAERFGCESSLDWKEVTSRFDIDAVVVCTPPNSHTAISIDALSHGKHVLCEKPLCRTLEEATQLAQAIAMSKKTFKCGFNHRYHPAMLEAKKLLDSGILGRPMVGRCRYGLVGRPGFEKEWRADPERAAGGQLGEQGIHGIDLFRWFIGEISDVSCMISTQFFKLQPMEDNGMAIFRMANGATASLHSSMTQWKNLFSLEVYGEDGYAQIEGLGGGYGLEKLTWGKRDFSAPFSHTTIEYRGGDTSWAAEWEDFAKAASEGRQPAMGTIEDGVKALELTLACYTSSKERRFVSMGNK